MKRTALFVALGLMALLALPALSEGPKEEKKKPSALAALAGRIVAAARVAEDDRVQLEGVPGDLDLLEELAVAVRKKGAHPLLTLASERLRRRLIGDVPARFDKQAPKMALSLAKAIDVYIGTEALDPSATRGLPAERVAAVTRAEEEVGKLRLKRNLRMVFLGNELYPSAARAKRFGLTVAELRKIYEGGLAADTSALTAAGAKVKKALAAGKELHLTDAGGTDLKVKIEKRPVLVSDGVLTAEKVKQGGASCLTWLPAGEVYLAPVAGSGDGVVVAPVAFWEGDAIENLKVKFKGGKVVSLTADKGLARLEASYKASGKGKELLGAIDVGLNPGVKAPKGSRLVSFVAAGTVTVSVGNNTWAGGDNSTGFGLNLFLPACTLKVDGQAVVEKGELKR